MPGINPRDTLDYIDNLTGMTPNTSGSSLMVTPDATLGGTPRGRSTFGAESPESAIARLMSQIEAIRRQIEMLMMRAMQGDIAALRQVQRLEQRLAHLEAQLAQAQAALQREQEQQKWKDSMAGVGASSSRGPSGPGDQRGLLEKRRIGLSKGWRGAGG